MINVPIPDDPREAWFASDAWWVIDTYCYSKPEEWARDYFYKHNHLTPSCEEIQELIRLTLAKATTVCL